jgi:hypothetical protein
MPDPNSAAGATPEAGATPAAGNESTTTTTDTDDGLGEAGKRALAALRRELNEVKVERDTALTAQRAREDAERTELEKAVRDKEEVATERDTLRTKVMRMEAAAAAGIPDQWQRLIGSTPEELAADAKSYAESLGTTTETPTAADLGAGARPGTPATGRDGFNAAIRARARR